MTALIALRQRAQSELESLRGGKVSICIDTGHVGAAAGSLLVADRFSAEAARQRVDLRITAVGSLGWREVEPLVAIARPEGQRIYYANATPALASELVAGLANGDDPRLDLAFAVDAQEGFAGLSTLVSLPFFAGQQRVSLRNVGLIDPEDLNDALVHGAYAGLARALAISPDAVIKEIEGADLRSRQTGVHVARRWRGCRQAGSGQHYVIANAAYGFDQCGPYDLLLEGNPHAVLEGILIAAYAVGANHAFLCIDPDSSVAIRRANLAIDQLRAVQLVGENLLGSAFRCEIEIRVVPRRLAGAEDTILISALEGRQPPQARMRPPETEAVGIFDKPTAVQDVESLALVSAILSGNATLPESNCQTTIVQLGGALACTGYAEVPIGTPVRTIVEQIGGGSASASGVKAVQIGGPAGGLIPASNFDVALDYEGLLKAGCELGSGSVFAAGDDSCAVDLARQAAAAAHRGSCGKCTFGREGTRQLMDVLTDLTIGRGLPADIDLLLNISDGMKAGSLCVNGRRAPDAVLTALQHFRSEFETHMNEKHCPANVCTRMSEIIGEKVAR